MIKVLFFSQLNKLLKNKIYINKKSIYIKIIEYS